MLNEFPSRFRQYEPFDDMQEKIKKFKQLNSLIIELKSEAMKERHWKRIIKKVGVKAKSI